MWLTAGVVGVEDVGAGVEAAAVAWATEPLVNAAPWAAPVSLPASPLAATPPIAKAKIPEPIASTRRRRLIVGALARTGPGRRVRRGFLAEAGFSATGGPSPGSGPA
ncbi:MAG: hypothetical protein JO027_10645, partial [Solirubrobacterales bacterium]|nr:hypothetical protein [Solirubrobacterales bacterium]